MAKGKSSIRTETHATDVLWGGDADKTVAAEATESTATTGGDATGDGLVVPFADDAAPVHAEPAAATASVAAPVDEAAEAARVARNEAIVADSLAHGRREETYDAFNKWWSFKEYIPGTNGSVDDATVRVGHEIRHPDGTTEVMTRYFQAGNLWPRGTVWSTIGDDGVETVTRVDPTEPGAIDLQVGDTRSIPANLTTAAGLAPSSWDPKADGSLGASRPSNPTSSWGTSSGSSTTSTGDGSTGFGGTTTDPGIDRHSAFTEPPDTSSSNDTDSSPGPGGVATDGDRAGASTSGSGQDSSAVDDTLGNLSQPAAEEPDAPSSRGGDASTDGLSLPAGDLASQSSGTAGSTGTHADVFLDDDGMTTVGGQQTNADGSVTVDQPGGGTITTHSDGTAEIQDADGNVTGSLTGVDYGAQSQPSAGAGATETVNSNSGDTSGTHPDDGSTGKDGTGGDDTTDDDTTDDGSTTDSGDSGDEGYIVDDGYSSAGAIPVASQGVGSDSVETAGSGHAQMTYSGTFGTFYGTLEHSQTGNPETVSGDYGNPNDETASGPPTQDDAQVPTADPLIHVDPDAGGEDESVGLALHDLQTSIHGGDIVNPNDPLFGNDTSAIPFDPHDSSPYEHDTGDMASTAGPADDDLMD